MAGKGPVDETTIRPPKVPGGARAAAPVPHVTVLWHPVLAQVGATAPLPAKLSRLEPDFAGAPLGVPHVSRTPVELARQPDGSLRVAAPAVVELVVDGAPLAGARTLPPAALARGIVLELAGRVALLVHLRQPSDPAAAGDGALLVGGSDAIRALRDEVARVAAVDLPVLVGGETGSGKEHVARALHAASARAAGPLVAVNMATLVPSMAASQLFGHARGAFTGADRAHVGWFEQADGGTLFLDEIADAPAEVQAMLLRVLETSELQPIGAERARRIDVRVIAATDADVGAAGQLRPQLYHRLAGARIEVPPLRARPDDIGRLLAHFVARELGALPALAPDAPPWLPSAALAAYVRHPWPGNVRELANVARRLALLGRTAPIDLAAALAPLGAEPPPRDDAKASPAAITDAQLVATLAEHGWRTGAAAAALGISKTTLYALIDRSPSIRTARELGADEIRACAGAVGRDPGAMAEHLKVSKRGLQLRMRELGIE